MKKRMLSMILAAGMMLSMSTVTFAAEGGAAITDDPEKTTVVSKGSYDVTLTGTVEKNSVLISVVMPTSIDFIISTTEVANSTQLVETKHTDNAATITANDSDGKSYGIFNKLYQGTGTVTNNSEAAVKLELTSSLNQTGKLLDMVDLSLKAKGVQDTGIDKSIALVAGKDYVTEGDSVLAASLAAKESGTTNGGQLTLQVEGAAVKGKVTGDGVTEYEVNIPEGEYTILTTLKVSLAQT